MCLAVPLKIIEVDGREAICERSGIRRSVRLDFVKDAKVGDFILSHAGFAIEKVEEDTASENLEAFAELQQALLEIRKEMNNDPTNNTGEAHV